MLDIRHELSKALTKTGVEVTGSGTDLITGEMDIGFAVAATKYKVTLKELK